jgi:SAM-dependent methyltransferase
MTCDASGTDPDEEHDVHQNDPAEPVHADRPRQSADAVRSDQAALWKGVGGQHWVQMQHVLDGLFLPVQQLLTETVVQTGACSVLDVGCGTGATTVAIAAALGDGARCTGLDISDPMIEAARRRAEQSGLSVDFVVADAQRHPFEPGSVEAVVSRFGVMFFDDEAAAFTNLRRAATDGAALRTIVWRSAEDNPFMTTAERAAAPLVTVPERVPGAPGQFAHADPDHVRRVLHDSGWRDVELTPIDPICTMPVADLDRYVVELGPLGRALSGADDGLRSRVLAQVRPAFDPYVDGGQVRFPAACWLVHASA